MAELDIEKLKSCTAIKQIPILTLDERWYHLITDKLKTDEICYCLLYTSDAADE